MVGISSTMIAIVDVEFAQGKFEIVHWKIFVPSAKQVIVVFDNVGLVIIPLPEIKVQIPVPTIGVLAAMVVFGLLIQIV